MEVQQNNEQKQEEYDLRDLIMALWRHKVLIICISFIAAIITGIFSMFVLSPVYHTKLNIIINMPETYFTKYGDYTLPITTNQQYINLITSNDILVNTINDMGIDANDMSIEDLRERITIEPVTTTVGVEQNSFKVQVAADSPSEVQQLAQILFDNYIEFLDVLTAEGAINYYINNYTVSLKSLQVDLETTQKLLSKNEELLATTPFTFNQKEAMQEIKNSLNTTKYVVLEDVINPNYTDIENDIIVNKQTIYDIVDSMRVYNDYLEELDIMKNSIVKYNENGQFVDLESSIVSITKTNVYLPSDPVAPTRKTSPSNTKNVIIGVFIGGMIGILAVLIKEYWFKKLNII
jgi:capsular polysaccharide biosynthesis protein